MSERVRNFTMTERGMINDALMHYSEALADARNDRSIWLPYWRLADEFSIVENVTA